MAFDSEDLINSIATDCRVSTEAIAHVIKYANLMYKVYKIPKRNGGKRVIAQPSEQLKTLQYWVVDHLLSKMPISEYAFAYRKAYSIKKHALKHADSQFVFHTDIVNFFPSINQDILRRYCIDANKEVFNDVFKTFDIDFDDIGFVLSRILLRKGKCSIGAVSSPALSNIIMCEFDEKLGLYCQEKGYTFTRYADDIYISSSERLPSTLKKVVHDRISKLGFEPNRSKTRFQHGTSNFPITGVNVMTNKGRVTLGHNCKQKIKHLLYQYLTKKEGSPEVILGYLSFAKEIEPSFYTGLIVKYAKYATEMNVLNTIKSDIHSSVS